MTDSASGTTNPTPNTCVDVPLDCNDIWSLAQQFACERVSTLVVGSHKLKTELSYHARARRIAATYARFYLEIEDGGNTDFIGRYYWMALGAFASKTVACLLALRRVQMLPALSDGFGRGNLWLFMDIAPWHWYWSHNPDSFEMCAPKRDAANYVPKVLAALKEMRWSAEALTKLNRLKRADFATNPLDFVKQGFDLVRDIEGMLISEKSAQGMEKAQIIKDRADAQLEHLKNLAKHEQGDVLQPLMYENENFADWTRWQRESKIVEQSKLARATPASTLINWIVPDLPIVFTADCQTDDPTLKNVVTVQTILENYNSRMDWIIGGVAKDFHRLMQYRRDYMENQLQTIAGWKDTAD